MHLGYASVKRRLALLVTWGVLAPSAVAGAQISVPGKLTDEHRAVAGQTYGGVIAVTNSTTRPQEARVYQTDYITQVDGAISYEDPGSAPRSNARWVTVGSRVIVPPGQSADIPYNVTVPNTPGLSGTYWSMVMIETIPPGSAESSLPGTSPARVGVGLTTRFRTGVQIITHVGTPGPPAAKFETAKVQSSDTAKALQFDLRNSGETSIRPVITLELYAEDGAHVTTLTSTRGLLHPGLALRQRFSLGRSIKPGRYRAVVTADLGGGTIIGARYNFTF
jgi:hypothetical protein